jgi:hypothetical protein
MTAGRTSPSLARASPGLKVPTARSVPSPQRRSPHPAWPLHLELTGPIRDRGLPRDQVVHQAIRGTTPIYLGDRGIAFPRSGLEPREKGFEPSVPGRPFEETLAVIGRRLMMEVLIGPGRSGPVEHTPYVRADRQLGFFSHVATLHERMLASRIKSRGPSWWDPKAARRRRGLRDWNSHKGSHDDCIAGPSREFGCRCRPLRFRSSVRSSEQVSTQVSSCQPWRALWAA